MKDFFDKYAEQYEFKYGIVRINDCRQYVDGHDSVRRENILSPAEEDYVRKSQSAKRKLEFVAGRLAAKTALCQWFDGDFQNLADITIVKKADGAPHFADCPECVISISHSVDFAVALLAKRPIGLDIEKIEWRPPALIRYFCHPAEKRIYEQQAEKNQADELVTTWWTRKEAISKYTQLGGRMLFRDMDTSRDSYVQHHPPASIRLISEVQDGYVVTIAV